MIYFLKEAKKSKANMEKWNAKAEEKFMVKTKKPPGEGDPILQGRPSQPCDPGVGTQANGNLVSYWPLLLLSHSGVPDCDPTDCSVPGSPVLGYLPEFAQIHVHWVSGAISRPLSARYFFRVKGSKYWMERNVYLHSMKPTSWKHLYG